MDAPKQGLISKLRRNIVASEGFRVPKAGNGAGLILGELENAFPNKRFPTGVLREFISSGPEDIAAVSSFIAGLMHVFLTDGGAYGWVSHTAHFYLTTFKRKADRLGNFYVEVFYDPEANIIRQY